MSAQPRLIEGIHDLLVHLYAGYLKSQLFHWNVQGPHFLTYHAFFETQYKFLAESIDEFAEHLRTLDQPVDLSFDLLAKKNKLIPDAPKQLNAGVMLQLFLKDYETLLKIILDLIQIAEECQDSIIEDALIELGAHFRKNIWMLKSLIAKDN